MKRTDWFDGEVKPVRAGVYERKYTVNNEVYFAYWSGTKWYNARDTVKRAVDSYNWGLASYTKLDHTKWRGLTSEQKQTVCTDAGVFAG